MARASVLILVAGFVLAGAAAAAPPVRVAILPILVHAEEGHDYLQAGMADMLASRIGKTEGVAVVRVTDESLATNDADKARTAGRAADADYVVYGSFTRFGQGASLDLRCTATQGPAPVRDVFVQAAELGQIIPELDEVAGKMARFAVTGQPSDPIPARTAGETSGGAAAGSGELDALKRRVDALEETVYRGGSVPEEDVSRGSLR